VVGGLPVPWVAQWSQESAQALRRPRIEQRPGPDGELVQTLVADNERRDRFGILWMAMSHRPGRGEPRFAELHPDRQRESMDRGLCQVCSTRIRPPVTFLAPSEWAYETLGGRRDRISTLHAPVCSGCASVSAQRCPHLRGEAFLFVAAQTVTPCAVVGDVYDLHSGEVTRRNMICRHDEPASRLLVARQRIAELEAWEPIEIP